MLACVGFIVQGNGITWPGYCSLPNQNGGEFWLGVPGDKVLPELSFGDFAGMNPVEQWAAFPSVGTVQILFFISAIESFTEYQQPHYTSPECEKIGSFKTFWWPGLSVYGKDPVRLQKARNAELNNGRAAMIGAMGFSAACVVDGSVPVLGGFGGL